MAQIAKDPFERFRSALQKLVDQLDKAAGDPNRLSEATNAARVIEPLLRTYLSGDIASPGTTEAVGDKVARVLRRA